MFSSAIEPAERGGWLRLIRTKRIGPHSFWSLIERFGTALEALEALPELSIRGGAKNPLTPFSAERAEQEYRGLRDIGGSPRESDIGLAGIHACLRLGHSTL